MEKFAVITGATSGFGRACAELLAAQNYNLVLTGRRAERLNELKLELSQRRDCNIYTLCFDVRDEDATNEHIDSLPDEVKNNIWILINNAGLAVGRGRIDEGVTDDWNRMIDTNVKGLLYVTKSVAPYLKMHRNSHIVNIASIAGKEVYPGGNVYCASKHAVDALSKAMRIDFVEFGIKVTNIAPGAAETEFSMVRFKGDQDKADAVYEGYDPLVAQDIAEAMWFAVSRPAHVTINDLVIMPTAQASSTVFHKK